MKKILLIVFSALIFMITAGLSYLKVGLPNVGKAPTMQIKADSALLARGSYLANHVMVCMDCHSQRDWNSFSGPPDLATLGRGGETFGEAMGFPGSFTAKNITPAALQNWTDGEIYHAISAGVNKEGKALFPVMPYLRYAHADEQDLRAVVAYLRSLAPIANEVAPSQPNLFMSFIMNTMPQKPTPQPRPDTTDLVAYGRYLTNVAACADCHTKQEKGKPVEGMDFAGGFNFPLPNGDQCTSANITPDVETGIGGWSEQAFVRRFKMYVAPDFKPHATPKGTYNSVMPWTMYAGMTETDLKAMYHYLKTLTPIKQKVTHFVSN